mmetsp:Transcript_25373/g.37784  ORF Transcript_25373/g.37784 Transcript_25373/m.37784 type:complete len:243 (+) Transcript_25373:817-1545(+)
MVWRLESNARNCFFFPCSSLHALIFGSSFTRTASSASSFCFFFASLSRRSFNASSCDFFISSTRALTADCTFADFPAALLSSSLIPIVFFFGTLRGACAVGGAEVEGGFTVCAVPAVPTVTHLSSTGSQTRFCCFSFFLYCSCNFSRRDFGAGELAAGLLKAEGAEVVWLSVGVVLGAGAEIPASKPIRLTEPRRFPFDGTGVATGAGAGAGAATLLGAGAGAGVWCTGGAATLTGAGAGAG